MMKRSVPALLIKELAYEICIIYGGPSRYQPAVWDAPGKPSLERASPVPYDRAATPRAFSPSIRCVRLIFRRKEEKQKRYNPRAEIRVVSRTREFNLLNARRFHVKYFLTRSSACVTRDAESKFYLASCIFLLHSARDAAASPDFIPFSFIVSD